MLRAEPKTILYFIWNYYDVIKECFDLQKVAGVVKKEELDEITKRHDVHIVNQLFEYKILKQVNNDYELREVYFSLLEHVLYEFKPVLPESLEKYYLSIAELFRKIKTGINDDKIILLERMKNLHHQVREFVDSIEKNTIRLLSETRDLKANIEKISYRDKVQKASFWIEYYIVPLNKILDVNEDSSVANKLLEISEYTNQKRLVFSDENIRLHFERLYNLLLQSNDDLLKQSKILTNELLPLIERIKSESLILSGFIEFLRNPYKTDHVHLLKTHRAGVYHNNIYLNSREFFEQFLLEEDTLVITDEENNKEERWIFNKEYYKKQLSQHLPVDDFFHWCFKTLNDEYKVVDTDKFFALTSLLFDETLNIEFSGQGETNRIRTNKSEIILPKLKVYNYGLPETA